MKLNNTLKWLMITLPTIMIAACSSTKNISNDQTIKSMSETNTGVHSNNSTDVSIEKQTHPQIQQNNTVYFDLNKYNIRFEFATMLEHHANFLRSNSAYKILIEGHTDERGTPEYNISLGERRANAVKMYLQSKGISADRISIVSYGKEKPIVLGHNEAAYAKNRRAVLIIKK